MVSRAARSGEVLHNGIRLRGSARKNHITSRAVRKKRTQKPPHLSSIRNPLRDTRRSPRVPQEARDRNSGLLSARASRTAMLRIPRLQGRRFSGGGARRARNVSYADLSRNFTRRAAIRG